MTTAIYDRQLRGRNASGFTLIELLVVVAIIALLVGILLPALAQARIRVRVTAVNAELYHVGLALEAYALDHQDRFPPTRADCDPSARDHWFSLPRELSAGGYLPVGRDGAVTFAAVEDRFNPGYTYKYIAVGWRLDYFGSPSLQSLYVPEGFPDVVGEGGAFHCDPRQSPVTWVLFSVGPNFDEAATTADDFPLHERHWYSPQRGHGLLTRVRMRNGRLVGSFE